MSGCTPWFSMTHWLFQVVAGEFRPRDVAPIQQRNLTANAAHASPGAFSDERPQLVILKEIAEDVAVGRCVVVGQHSHRPMKDIRRDRVWLSSCAPSPCPASIRRKPLEDQLIHKAAAVVANINDQSFFADLREVLFHKFVQAIRRPCPGYRRNPRGPAWPRPPSCDWSRSCSARAS